MKDKVLKILLPTLSAVLIALSVLNIALLSGAGALTLLCLAAASVCLAGTVAINKHPAVALIFIALFAAAVLVLKSFSSAMLLYLFFAPVGVTVGFVFRKNLTLNSAVAAATVVTLVFGIATFCGYVYESGNDGFDIKTALKPVSSAVKQTTDELADIVFTDAGNGSTYYENSLGESLTEDELEDAKKDLSTNLYESVIAELPVFIGEFFLLMTVLAYYIVKRLLAGTSVDLSNATGFTRVRVSRAGALICALGFVVPLFTTGITVSEMLYEKPWLFAVNIFAELMQIVLAFAGISAVVYILLSKKVETKRKVFTGVFALAGFLIAGVSVPALFGIFDSLRDVRGIGGEKSQ